VYVDGIDLGSPLQPLVNPPHNMEIRYDLDVDGDGLPDRDRLYVGWYRGGFQAFDFALAGFTARPLYHQVQTEAADDSWDGAWAVRIERIGDNVYTFQSDRRYGLIVERVGVGTDTDGDGCTDSEEMGPDEQAGGDRDPLYYYDFFDVTDEKSIGLSDALLILAHFGHGAAQDALDDKLDRYIPNALKPWRTAAADNGVGLIDALVNLRSFGHSCVAPP